MSEQPILIDKQLLKEVLLEMMQEQRSDFKSLLREVLHEYQPVVSPVLPTDSLLGLFADTPKLIDDIMADIYADRGNILLRAHG